MTARLGWFGLLGAFLGMGMCWFFANAFGALGEPFQLPGWMFTPYMALGGIGGMAYLAWWASFTDPSAPEVEVKH